MANITLIPGLPDFDSPTLEEEMERIADSDREIQAKISDLMDDLTWHEKMAVGLTAYLFIDTTHHQLLKLVPVHGELPESVQEAMRLLENLSPQSLAELATEILEEDFEGEIEVGDES